MKLTRRFLLVALSCALSSLSAAQLLAADRRVKCPVVVDRESGRFSTSSAKYRCYSRATDARRGGYRKHSFSDDSNCTASVTPTAGSTPAPGGVGTGDYNYSGPGQRDSAVFVAANGGTVSYNFPGGGQFELKVMRASNDRRVEQILEASHAASGSVPFSGFSFPTFIKIEGPGQWSVAINVNE